MPGFISNPNGTAAQPESSTMIQIGFLYPLNYQFIVAHAMSLAQIFQWLPIGLADGLGLQQQQVVVQSLVPLDTTQTLGYITTLAYVYIPENMVNTLALDLHVPTAPIYHNPSTPVNTLMNYINPAIPLTPGSTLTGSEATGTGGNKAATTSAPTDNGPFNEAAQKPSSSTVKSTAGIATGVVGAAAAYGAAMFFIARRYKRRRQSHRRTSSLLNPSEMMQSGSPALPGGSNAFMAGGRTSPGEAAHDRYSRGSGRSAGNSARTQLISAPMMAENSLGWN
jgi:hypothetical protein